LGGLIKSSAPAALRDSYQNFGQYVQMMIPSATTIGIHMARLPFGLGTTSWLRGVVWGVSALSWELLSAGPPSLLAPGSVVRAFLPPVAGPGIGPRIKGEVSVEAGAFGRGGLLDVGRGTNLGLLDEVAVAYASLW